MSTTPEDVARYLKDHPEFFEDYSELLATIQVRHPHGKHAIPLSERQVLTLRERSRALEGKLRELVQFGEENDTISDRVHRVGLALMAARNAAEVIEVTRQTLAEEFGVPGVAVRLWHAELHDEGAAADAPASEEMRLFAESLANPYFCEQPMFESADWFTSAGDMRSLVYVPLRARQPLGVLAMASGDPARFTADMGTLYVVRLGELVSAALARQV